MRDWLSRRRRYVIAVVVALLVLYITGPQLHAAWQDQRTDDACPSGSHVFSAGFSCERDDDHKTFPSKTTIIPEDRAFALYLTTPGVRLLDLNFTRAVYLGFGLAKNPYAKNPNASRY